MKKLLILDSRVGDEGAVSLSEMLKENSFLIKLVLRGSHVVQKMNE